MIDYLVNIVVEVHVASTEVTTKHCGMSGKDCSDVDVPRTTHNQSNTSDPLVKMCHQIRRAFYLLLILAHSTSQIIWSNNRRGHRLNSQAFPEHCRDQ